MITSSSFAFKAQNANIEQSTHLTMFKMIHKMMLTFVKSQRNHADKIRIIISKICNGFCIQNCERFTALVDAIYCNVLNDTSQSSYQKANELNLFVWIELTRMITNWLIGHQETVAVWTDNNPNRLQLKLYNHLMWPLGRSMKEIGVSLKTKIQISKLNVTFRIPLTRPLVSESIGKNWPPPFAVSMEMTNSSMAVHRDCHR